MSKFPLSIVLGVAIAGILGSANADPGATHEHKQHEALQTVPYATTGSCGVERWSVKTGTDPDAGLVDVAHPVRQTIAYLDSLTPPGTLPPNNRVQPTETTVFIVNATLVEYKLETDSDYHLVLKDSQGNTMIAEIPAPACVGVQSPFLPSIRYTRRTFDSRIHPNDTLAVQLWCWDGEKGGADAHRCGLF